MATVYISHDPADRAFVESTLLPPLPSLGFEWWISSDGAPSGSDAALESAFRSCQAVVVVISKAARESSTVRREVDVSGKARLPTIVIQLDETEPESVCPGLEMLPKISAADARASVALQLPPAGPDDHDPPKGARRIEWNETVFSDFLKDAMARHDFSRGELLMSALARHIGHRTSEYPSGRAKEDLRTLRQKRQFLLMERYAGLLLESGSQDLHVRRQYGQSLIEQGRFDEALGVLKQVAAEAPRDHFEYSEALGLIGRLYKQQYVNDPDGPSAPDFLRRSIEAYYSIYQRDPKMFWHGVNTASLLVRARRDGVEVTGTADAGDIASAILRTFDELRKSDEVYVWDYASRVEALIALGKFDDAEPALDEYLAHREMHAFELGSTFRQFDQVLQLGSVPEGQALMDRIWRAHCARAGAAATRAQQRENVERPDLLPIVVRVSDPNWSAGDLAGVTIGARLGTVITARATRAAIQSLLKDPIVLDIEESRTVVDVATLECARGMPFVRVADGYSDSVGTFDERGRHALIAIIDDGIDVLHEAFTDAAGRSRIVGVWDQRDDTGPAPAGFNYGTLHTANDIQRYVASGTVEKNLGRNENAPGIKAHGTHVASIAAGRAVGAVYRGVAPEARILAVRTRADGDIGYSNSHLEALTFIDRVASDLKCPVVVNVSKGMNAAAHDGKSALEVGFDMFSEVGRKPGRVVVKSAGNEGDTGGHAEISVPTGGADELRWLRAPQPFGFEQLELWWSAADSLVFKLRSPGGDTSPPVSNTASDVSGQLRAGGWFHLQLTKGHQDNGDNRLLIRIGEGTDPKRARVAHGIWALEIESIETLSGKPIHAWIARLGGDPSAFQNAASGSMTITVPGTAQSVIAVGAVEARDPTKRGSFSSCGPTRDGREKPDLVAPGVNVTAAQAGTPNGARTESGTSMAAPYVAGAVALVLSRAVETGRDWPNANQIASALRYKTRNFNGHHDPGQGYGVLDIGKVLGAF